MVGLFEIPRTAAFAWSPGTGSPSIATGTRAGAVDAEFSNETQLELWDLNLDSTKQGSELQPWGSIETDSRFHDIAWVKENDSFPRGIIAGALENGSFDLWNAEKLLNRQGNSFMSRTSRHSGAIKALQFNPFRPELLATAGAKGELFISDFNNIQNPFRMGNSVARVDDFGCLDWNKNVPHILATGSSGGFVTVWDVKTKKESLTLNNSGRKAVSAVAWDPNKHIRLITAIPDDTDPLILVWDLRNSSAPERTLQGHDGGVLSLSWCPQDNDLLLSCGKDNRTICWNPQTAESYGEFPVVTNWTFQTRWNPHNPNLLATASFDGKIAIHTIQNFSSDTHPASGKRTQAVNDEDFFNKAQSQPQGARFTLKKAPKWLERPCGASFGFGGKVLSFSTSFSSSTPRKSTIRISTFAIDAGVGTSTEAFENALKGKDLQKICDSKLVTAMSDTEKADWKVIKTLISRTPKTSLVDYLGFSSADDEEVHGLSSLSIDVENKEDAMPHLDVSSTRSNRLSAFFDSHADGDSFLSDLAATKGAKINNPFQVYSGSESESDRKITRALLLGQFHRALNVCLQEDRLSDAFMVAICGGQACIDKVQKAYFSRKLGGPNYLRLLASIVGKNLWDVVYNAELSGWKEVMAIILTYASEEEYSDLCEALGDRLDEQWKTGDEDPDLLKNASFCYLAGSKLEKVVKIWISELDNHERTYVGVSSGESSFSIHARSLQSFIEKVTVFREVTRFDDCDREPTSGWKLGALYDKYAEYADIIASHGKLQIAQKYLDLLPEKYPGAEVARNRIKEAIRRPVQGRNASPSIPAESKVPNITKRNGHQENLPNPPTARRGAPGVSAPTFSSYPRTNQANNTIARTSTSDVNVPPSIAPPSKAPAMTNWNDTPESFFKPPTSRRGTPSVGPPPKVIGPGTGPLNPPYGVQPKSVPPVGNAYAPQHSQPNIRYAPSPPVQLVNNRYAPSPSVQPAASLAPETLASGQKEAPSGPPQAVGQGSRPGTAQSHRVKPAGSKYPSGDRSHIPTVAKAIFEILGSDMQRVKARAPQSFTQQVNDTEKRLNILFDHLNNEDLLKEQTVKDMVKLAQSLQARNYEQANMIHVDIMTNRTEECGNWMVGVKRLIGMSKATP